ncbi:MAG: rRNA maturation RNase YbeY [bacterium]|nr:rRNA maturation RNase YbeY [bacterium]
MKNQRQMEKNSLNNHQNKLTVNINNDTKVRFNFTIRKFIKKILTLKQIESGFFDFNFVKKDTIINLNKEHLNKSYSTDIISFNLGDQDNIIGDVYICVEQAKKNAKEYKNTLDDEIKLLIVHGILHLAGYEDYSEKDRASMELEQNRLLLLSKHLKDKPYKNFSFITSLICAVNGLKFTFYTERSMILHSIIALMAIGLAFFLEISRFEWLILIFTISLVLIVETINTSVEISIDLVTKKKKYRAMLAKDIAAGAVLLCALNSLIVGYLIFFDRLVNLFTGGS